MSIMSKIPLNFQKHFNFASKIPAYPKKSPEREIAILRILSSEVQRNKESLNLLENP